MWRRGSLMSTSFKLENVGALALVITLPRKISPFKKCHRNQIKIMFTHWIYSLVNLNYSQETQVCHYPLEFDDTLQRRTYVLTVQNHSSEITF